MSKNLVMQEYAIKDKRSVAAMLRGCGDGREKKWLKFEAMQQGLITQEEIQHAFFKKCNPKKISASEVYRATFVYLVTLLLFLTYLTFLYRPICLYRLFKSRNKRLGGKS